MKLSFDDRKSERANVANRENDPVLIVYVYVLQEDETGVRNKT